MALGAVAVEVMAVAVAGVTRGGRGGGAAVVGDVGR